MKAPMRKTWVRETVIALIASTAIVLEGARAEETFKPVFGGFVDTYYSYSTARPPNFDRQYTTQGVRSNEFNINLAFLEAKIESDRARGRVAIQAGTSVQSNYAGEPANGSNSGSLLSRHIQEAFAGYRVGDQTWVDAGIMFSHIGYESFISRDNPVYTRSLVADFSPYYQSGVRISHTVNSQVSMQALVLNGWQNISESNSSKALGAQIAVQATDAFSIAYNTFIGKEFGFRHFHDLVLKYRASPKWVIGTQADVGFQDASLSGGSASWHGFTLISRHQVSEHSAVSIRFERYSDPKNVIVSTPGADPFRAWGGSLGFDRNLSTQLVWRSEIRSISTDRDVYLTRTQPKSQETLFASSLGLTF